MATKSVTVDGITIKKTVFGGVVVIYSCPECEEILRSPVLEIGIKDECPNCNCAFFVPGEKAFRFYLTVLKQEADTRAAEIQRQEYEKNQALKAEELKKKKAQEINKQKVTELQMQKATNDNETNDLYFIFGLMFLPPVAVGFYFESQSGEGGVAFAVSLIFWWFILAHGMGSTAGSPRSSTARSIDNLTTYLVIRDSIDRMDDNYND